MTIWSTSSPGRSPGRRARAARGRPRVALLTLGGEGALDRHARRGGTGRGPGDHVVDTIGAGDAFGGGFLAMAHHGLDRDALEDADAVRGRRPSRASSPPARATAGTRRAVRSRRRALILRASARERRQPQHGRRDHDADGDCPCGDLEAEVVAARERAEPRHAVAGQQSVCEAASVPRIAIPSAPASCVETLMSPERARRRLRARRSCRSSAAAASPCPSRRPSARRGRTAPGSRGAGARAVSHSSAPTIRLIPSRTVRSGRAAPSPARSCRARAGRRSSSSGGRPGRSARRRSRARSRRTACRAPTSRTCRW